MRIINRLRLKLALLFESRKATREVGFFLSTPNFITRNTTNYSNHNLRVYYKDTVSIGCKSGPLVFWDYFFSKHCSITYRTSRKDFKFEVIRHDYLTFRRLLITQGIIKEPQTMTYLDLRNNLINSKSLFIEVIITSTLLQKEELTLSTTFLIDVDLKTITMTNATYSNFAFKRNKSPKKEIMKMPYERIEYVADYVYKSDHFAKGINQKITIFEK